MTEVHSDAAGVSVSGGDTVNAMTMLEKAARAAASEIERQVIPQVADYKDGKWGASQSYFSGPSSIFGTCQINGEVDLRSVARAVLLAVREGSPEIFAAMEAAQPKWPSSQCDNARELAASSNDPKLRAAIDAVLNDGA